MLTSTIPYSSIVIDRSEIIHERKCLQILWILVRSWILSCIISFQKEIIHNGITKFANVFSWTLWQSTYCKSFLSQTIPDIRYWQLQLHVYYHLTLYTPHCLKKSNCHHTIHTVACKQKVNKPLLNLNAYLIVMLLLESSPLQNLSKLWHLVVICANCLNTCCHSTANILIIAINMY